MRWQHRTVMDSNEKVEETDDAKHRKSNEECSLLLAEGERPVQYRGFPRSIVSRCAGAIETAAAYCSQKFHGPTHKIHAALPPCPPARPLARMDFLENGRRQCRRPLHGAPTF